MSVALDAAAQANGVPARQRGSSGLPPHEPVAVDVDEFVAMYGAVTGRWPLDDPRDQHDGIEPLAEVS
jgi:hypothetical protein